MSIFLVILLALLPAGFIFGVGAMIINCNTSTYQEENRWLAINGIICACIAIGFGFAIPAWSDEADHIYVQGYLAQKYTIEMSLESEELSGLERIELVRQAAEANRELAEKKASFNLWHCVHYDYTIFDNVELIDLGG